MEVFVEVPCTVCATPENLIGLSALVEAGWSFHFTEQGHFIVVPHIGRFLLTSRPLSSLAYIHLVQVPGSESNPKVTVYDPSNVSHCHLTKQRIKSSQRDVLLLDLTSLSIE